MANVSVEEEFNLIPELTERLEYLRDKKLEIGVFGEEGDSYGSGITVLAIARIHEYGLDIQMANGKTMTIPRRSFVRAGFDEKKDDIDKQVRAVVDQIIGFEVNPEDGMAVVGEVVATLIRQYAIDLQEPHNKESTVEQKGSSNPLVDTGLMIDNITYRIR